MPKVKGFTPAQNRKRDEIERAVERSGKPKSSAYAIATAEVQAMKAKGKPARKARGA